MIKVLSLFSGIGAFEKALKTQKINYEIVGFSEIEEYVVKAYCTIHNEPLSKSLGDITKIDPTKLPDFDLLTHGSPCQDFSIIGKQQGADINSNTRSSLMWNTVEIVKIKKPKIVIWENVKNALSKNHRHNFDKYLELLSSLGYKNFYKVLNAKDYGVPQNRERIFVISSLIHNDFTFPEEIQLTKQPKDLLEDGYKYDTYVDEENKIDSRIKRGCKIEFANHYDKIINSTKEIYDCRAKTDFQDKKVGIKVSPCLKAKNSNIHVLNGKRIQRLNSKEHWRFMGFTDDDYEKAKSTGCKDSQLCGMAGNSIVINILEQIFIKLLK